LTHLAAYTVVEGYNVAAGRYYDLSEDKASSRAVLPLR